MALENFKQLLSVTATVSTIIQFMTGIIICWSIKKKGASEDISGFPFIAGVLGCSLWLRYGMLLGDTAMTIVNVVGVLLQLFYTGLFLPLRLTEGTISETNCDSFLYYCIYNDLCAMGNGY